MIYSPKYKYDVPLAMAAQILGRTEKELSRWSKIKCHPLYIWKENFLKQLEFESLFQGKNYHIKGLPFYTESNKNLFDEACKNILKV